MEWKLNLFGHIGLCRMKNNRLVKGVMFVTMEGETRRGRSCRECLDDIKEWCEEEIHILNRKAQNRGKWSTVVNTALDTYGRWAIGVMDGRNLIWANLLCDFYSVFINNHKISEDDLFASSGDITIKNERSVFGENPVRKRFNVRRQCLITLCWTRRLQLFCLSFSGSFRSLLSNSWEIATRKIPRVPTRCSLAKWMTSMVGHHCR